MKKNRQLEIEIRQREISLAIHKGAVPRGEPAASTSAAAEQPTTPCSVCGADWVLLYDASAAVPPVTGQSVRAVLETLPLHVYASAAGHLWICRTSFDQLKEQRK